MDASSSTAEDPIDFYASINWNRPKEADLAHKQSGIFEDYQYFKTLRGRCKELNQSL